MEFVEWYQTYDQQWLAAISPNHFRDLCQYQPITSLKRMIDIDGDMHKMCKWQKVNFKRAIYKFTKVLWLVDLIHMCAILQGN